MRRLTEKTLVLVVAAILLAVIYTVRHALLPAAAPLSAADAIVQTL
jgi:hypothetical protein